MIIHRSSFNFKGICETCGRVSFSLLAFFKFPNNIFPHWLFSIWFFVHHQTVTSFSLMKLRMRELIWWYSEMNPIKKNSIFITPIMRSRNNSFLLRKTRTEQYHRFSWLYQTKISNNCWVLPSPLELFFVCQNN